MIKLCQNCGERPSSTVAKMNINGQERDICLCTSCAQKLGIVEVPKFEQVMFGATTEKVCPSCGTKESEFLKGGIAGCAKCYYFFGGAQNAIEKVCGSSKHCGKASNSTVLSKSRMETLLMRIEDATKRRDTAEVLRLKKEISMLGEGNANKQ